MELTHAARPRQRHACSSSWICKPGDVLPCDFTGKATVLAEGVPLFRGAFGVSRGQQCRADRGARPPLQAATSIDAMLACKP